jgi:hypothetical protein
LVQGLLVCWFLVEGLLVSGLEFSGLVVYGVGFSNLAVYGFGVAVYGLWVRVQTILAERVVQLSTCFSTRTQA